MTSVRNLFLISKSYNEPKTGITIRLHHFLLLLYLLTHCPSPDEQWCVASHPSFDHGWGGQQGPAFAGPGFHSLCATVGERDPPHFSVR